MSRAEPTAEELHAYLAADAEPELPKPVSAYAAAIAHATTPKPLPSADTKAGLLARLNARHHSTRN